MKTISVKLPQSLATWLSRLAKRLGRTQSDIIRDTLKRYRAGDPSSCHALLEDVCGKLKGPRNLSTSAGHMDGFGR